MTLTRISGRVAKVASSSPPSPAQPRRGRGRTLRGRSRDEPQVPSFSPYVRSAYPFNRTTRVTSVRVRRRPVRRNRFERIVGAKRDKRPAHRRHTVDPFISVRPRRTDVAFRHLLRDAADEPRKRSAKYV